MPTPIVERGEVPHRVKLCEVCGERPAEFIITEGAFQNQKQVCEACEYQKVMVERGWKVQINMV